MQPVSPNGCGPRGTTTAASASATRARCCSARTATAQVAPASTLSACCLRYRAAACCRGLPSRSGPGATVAPAEPGNAAVNRSPSPTGRKTTSEATAMTSPAPGKVPSGALGPVSDRAPAPASAGAVPFPQRAVRPFWSYVRGLLAPVVIWGLVIAVLARPVEAWLAGQDSYDQDALNEWLDESRGSRDTLPEMVERYLKLRDAYRHE